MKPKSFPKIIKIECPVCFIVNYPTQKICSHMIEYSFISMKYRKLKIVAKFHDPINNKKIKRYFLFKMKKGM
jgi:hypothetical protein